MFCHHGIEELLPWSQSRNFLMFNKNISNTPDEISQTVQKGCTEIYLKWQNLHQRKVNVLFLMCPVMVLWSSWPVHTSQRKRNLLLDGSEHRVEFCLWQVIWWMKQKGPKAWCWFHVRSGHNSSCIHTILPSSGMRDWETYEENIRSWLRQFHGKESSFNWEFSA